MCLNEKRVLTIPSRKAYGTFTLTKKNRIPRLMRILNPLQALVALVMSSRQTLLSSSTSNLSGYSPRFTTSCSTIHTPCPCRTSVP